MGPCSCEGSQSFRSKKIPLFLGASWATDPVPGQPSLSRSQLCPRSCDQPEPMNYSLLLCGVADPVTPWRRVSLSSKTLPRAVSVETRELERVEPTRSSFQRSEAKSGRGLTLRPQLKVGGCLLTDLWAVLIVSCPSSHPAQFGTIPLGMTNGTASL